MVPEVIRLPLHYIRQIVASLRRVLASEFYNSSFFPLCNIYVTWGVCVCVVQAFRMCACVYLQLISCIIDDHTAVLQQGPAPQNVGDESSCGLWLIVSFESP